MELGVAFVLRKEHVARANHTENLRSFSWCNVSQGFQNFLTGDTNYCCFFKVTSMGLKTPFRDGLLRHVAQDVVNLAKVGKVCGELFMVLNVLSVHSFLVHCLHW